jgi:hypothetical protein
VTGQCTPTHRTAQRAKTVEVRTRWVGGETAPGKTARSTWDISPDSSATPLRTFPVGKLPWELNFGWPTFERPPQTPTPPDPSLTLIRAQLVATLSKPEKKNRLRKGDLQTSATPRKTRPLSSNERVSGSSPLVGSLFFVGICRETMVEERATSFILERLNDSLTPTQPKRRIHVSKFWCESCGNRRLLFSSHTSPLSLFRCWVEAAQLDACIIGREAPLHACP